MIITLSSRLLRAMWFPPWLHLKHDFFPSIPVPCHINFSCMKLTSYTCFLVNCTRDRDFTMKTSYSALIIISFKSNFSKATIDFNSVAKSVSNPATKVHIKNGSDSFWPIKYTNHPQATRGCTHRSLYMSFCVAIYSGIKTPINNDCVACNLQSPVQPSHLRSANQVHIHSPPLLL